MMSLPIPDQRSGITYDQIRGNEWLSMGDAVSQLARMRGDHGAHLDPDLVEESIPREKSWKPVFGQVNAAEGHLRRQGVGKGDVFLFFGLFRSVEKATSGWKFVRGAKPIHCLFGWLQIAERIPVASWPSEKAWALYHPHFQRSEPSNVIYIATERLSLAGGSLTKAKGAGIFARLTPALRLTAPESDRPGPWLLPAWFHPEGRSSCLTYHNNTRRWTKTGQGVLLDAVSRGQEFVLDCHDYPEAPRWLEALFSANE